MATSKRRTPRTTTKTSTRRRAPTTAKSSTTPSSTTAKQSFASRTGTAMKNRPVTTAAIATGVVSGIAAAVAGFFAFKKSGKTFGEFSDDVATSVKESASNAKTKIKDGIADAKAKAKDWSEPKKDGIDDDFRPQSEIAEEALTAKTIGKKTKRPLDPTIEEELKVGSISY